MATDIDKIFAEADAGSGVEASPPAMPNGGVKPPTDLAAKVAEKRAAKGASGKQAMIQGKGGSAASAGNSETASTVLDAASQPLAATDGISPDAKDELAKLAARKEGETSPEQTQGKNTASAASGKRNRQSAPSTVATSTGATASSSGDVEMPTEIPGLTSTPPTNGEGGPQGNAFEERQKQLQAARNKGKTPKVSAKEKAAKAKAAAKEKADREKAKAKEKTEKQKAKEKERAEKKKAEAADRKKRDDERKAKIAADKRKRAEERAAKATPDLLAKEPAAVKALFAEHYRLAGPKTERNPEGQGLRRAKADRGDFCAGWVMLLRAFRKEGKGQLPQVEAATKARELPAAPAEKS